MVISSQQWQPPLQVTWVGGMVRSSATTANVFNTMVATSAISLGIRADELDAFMYAVNSEGVTALAPIDFIYKGILNAAMKIIEKRGD